jgi:sulfite oxidase
LLASGKSIEPFWQIYAAHNHKDVHKILEELRIGNLDPADVKALEEERIKRYGPGPYSNEPFRHPAMKINSSQPFNSEPPPELLMENFITPNDLFFVMFNLIRLCSFLQIGSQPLASAGY